MQAYIFVIGVLLAACGLYAFWARRVAAEIAESADLHYARFAENDPAAIEGVDASRFRAIYMRTHFPRFPKYALAAACGFVISLPVAMGVLSALAYVLGKLGVSEKAELLAKSIPLDGATFIDPDARQSVAYFWIEDVMRLFYFFGLLAAWLGVVFVVMRRYHARRPGYLEDELRQEQVRLGLVRNEANARVDAAPEATAESAPA